MSELHWNWLCAPYLVCAITMVAVGAVAALVRGDQVMRLGVIGAATTALPWALCSGLATCTDDPDTATRLLRLGSGTVSLIGPNLLLVLLGVSGQLERNRWVARLSGLIGVTFMALCWGTDLTVPGVHRLSSGILYTTAGPLTAIHISQLGLWLAIGMLIVRRTSTGGERRRMQRLLMAVLVLGTIGSVDVLLAYDVWGWYPISWLPAIVGGLIALYLVLYTDLLRPQGLDRNVVTEALGFAATAIVVGVLSYLFAGTTPIAEVAIASFAYAIALGVTWTMTQQRPVRVASERALEEFVSRVAELDDEHKAMQRLSVLWKTVGIEVRGMWRTDGDALVEVSRHTRWPLDREAAAWLIEYGQALAPGDLATMRVGVIRPKLEALVTAHDVTLVVPVIDRGVLVGLIEGDHEDALREDERGLVIESARAVGRAMTYAALARAAAEEGASAREVEVAEAMRLQASASRDDELGRWSVGAEYRTAPRTNGAGWSASLLADGRLAVLVTEAQGHGVAAALATAALTGAFAAATGGSTTLTLGDLLASLRASAEGVMRGGEPIGAFVAICDADAQTVAWASAGHPGGTLVAPSRPQPTSLVLGGGGARLGETSTAAVRGEAKLPPDVMLVIASTAVRGTDEDRWSTQLRELAPAGPRLASVLVEAAVRTGERHEDFLAVVVRQRLDRRSEPVISPIR